MTRDFSTKATLARRNAAWKEAVVAIGASAGGTRALCEALEILPDDRPGCLIVQHMTAPFTEPFAASLYACSLEYAAHPPRGRRMR